MRDVQTRLRRHAHNLDLNQFLRVDCMEATEEIDRLRAASGTIRGETALALARLFHLLGMDSPGQWGNAYFRCPTCGAAHDCDGEEDWEDGGRFACECEHNLSVDDLVVSEGWVERELAQAAEDAAETCAELRAALERCRDALRPFAALAELADGVGRNIMYDYWTRFDIDHKDIRAAVAALAAEAALNNVPADAGGE